MVIGPCGHSKNLGYGGGQVSSLCRPLQVGDSDTIKRGSIVSPRLLFGLMALVLLWFALRSISWAELIQILRSINPWQLLLLILLNVTIVFTLSARWWYFLRILGHPLRYGTLVRYQLFELLFNFIFLLGGTIFIFQQELLADQLAFWPVSYVIALLLLPLILLIAYAIGCHPISDGIEKNRTIVASWETSFTLPCIRDCASK